jgi:Golgi phosphoprotein 3 (GPP34)
MRTSHPRHLLADELFLAAHRDDGKPRLSQQAMRIGLAGALLGEVVLAGNARIDTRRREIAVVKTDPPASALTHAVLDQLVGAPETAIRDWLNALGQNDASGNNAYSRVADRLISAGVVRAANSAGLWHRSTVYPPNDANEDISAQVRLFGRLSKKKPLDPDDVLLVGLAIATDLDRYLFQDLDSEGHRYLRVLLQTVPPALRCLITETKSAVGNAVLNRHR